MATVIDELVALLGYDIKGEEELKRFNKGLDSLEKKAYAVGAAVRNFAMIGGAAVAGGMALLGRGVIGVSAQFETYQATLETIEGSAEKAKASMDWVSNFAKTTPFEVSEVTEAFVKLKSYGIDPMDGSLIALGDTASGMGKSLNQAVEAFADAATGEFERLKEFGIKAKQQGEQVTFTWTKDGKELTKTVKKNSTEITQFLKKTMGERFGGAMLRQSKTWKGMISNLSDSWVDFQRRIGDAGFFQVVKDRLAGVMDAIESWANDGTIQKVSNTLSNAFTAIANGVGTVVERIRTHINFLSENFERLGPYIKSIGMALGVLVAAAFPVVTAFIGIGLAIDDLLTWMQGGESVIGQFVEWLRTIIPGSKAVEDAIIALGAAITTGLIAALVLAPATMAGIAGRLAASLATALATSIIAALTGLGSAIVTGFTAAFALLSNPVGWGIILAGVAAALVAYFWADLQAIWNATDFTSLGTTIGKGILAGLQSMGGAIAAWFESIVPAWAKQGFTMGGVTSGGVSNIENNAAKLGASIGAMGAKISREGGTQNNNVNVQAPVTVQVTTPTQAPAAVGNAVSGAINKAAQPSRMQTGPAR